MAPTVEVAVMHDYQFEQNLTLFAGLFAWRGCAVPGCGVHLYCFIDSLVYCFSNYQLARNSPIEPRDEMECNKKHGAAALHLS